MIAHSRSSSSQIIFTADLPDVDEGEAGGAHGGGADGQGRGNQDLGTFLNLLLCSLG